MKKKKIVFVLVVVLSSLGFYQRYSFIFYSKSLKAEYEYPNKLSFEVIEPHLRLQPGSVATENSTYIDGSYVVSMNVKNLL